MDDKQRWLYTGILATVIVVASMGYRRISGNGKGEPPSMKSDMGIFVPAVISTLKTAKSVLTKGHELYPTGVFQMNVFPFGQVYVINGVQLIEELRSAPDDVFSFVDFAERLVQHAHTLGNNIVSNRYHVPIVRTTLTRNLAGIFPEIVDEMDLAFKDIVGLSGREWKSFHAYSTVMQIVCRASNRVIVGAPMCQNPTYQKLNTDFTIDVMKAATKINFFPSFLHLLVAQFFTRLPKYQKEMSKVVGSIIKDRRKNIAMYGTNWADKPNDYLMWLMEEPTGQLETDKEMVNRLLHINFAAIHTSTTTFTHALYHLATSLEWQGILREEVKRLIQAEGWTKASMQKMRKLDSFFRESARMNSIALISLGRRARKPFNFSDGTHVRGGQWVVASAWSTHMDEKNYKDPMRFDPWRFAEIREGDGEGTKHQMVATSADYLSFGYGRHACPGRFFAANELKAMMCYIVLHYDVKLDNEGERPANEYFGISCSPNRQANVLLRKRD